MFEVIDLHLTEDIINSPFYEPKDSLRIQLDLFEKELDNALVRGINGLIVIHGIGEGILKNAIHKILKQHPYILEYINDYHPLYGWGSTKITFK